MYMPFQSNLVDYTQFVELSLDAGRAEIKIVSKPGLPDWDRILPAEMLLMESAKAHTQGTTLLLGCHHGVLAAHYARLLKSPARLIAADTNHLALTCTRRSLERNGLPEVELKSLYEMTDTQVDCAILVPPRGRVQGRAWLAAAASMLRPEGQLFIAGANDEGIQSLIKDAASLMGSCKVLTYRKGSRVAFSRRPAELNSPEWLNEPGTQPGTFYQHQITLPDGHPLEINSLPGVFSYEHLDTGSALLLNHLPALIDQLPQMADILDVGCGYGILGLAAAHLAPYASISMVDIDLAAIVCARLNSRANNLTNTGVFPSDLLDGCENQRYHLILSNPPFHAGKQVRFDATHALIAQAQKQLHPGGSLAMVANRFIRYERKLQEFFTHVEILAETPHFHLLRASSNIRQEKRRKKKQ